MSVYEDLATQLSCSCPVCLDNYDITHKSPLIIPCGHTICQYCVAHLPRHYGEDTPPSRMISCPVCRTKFTLNPEYKKSYGFPINAQLYLIAEKMLEASKREEDAKSRRLEVKCRDCHRKFTAGSCVKCECFENEESGPEMDLLNRDTSKLLCNDCVNKSHKEHAHQSFQNLTNQFKTKEIIKRLTGISERRYKIREAIRELSSPIAKMEQLIVPVGEPSDNFISERRTALSSARVPRSQWPPVATVRPPAASAIAQPVIPPAVPVVPPVVPVPVPAAPIPVMPRPAPAPAPVLPPPSPPAPATRNRRYCVPELGHERGPAAAAPVLPPPAPPAPAARNRMVCIKIRLLRDAMPMIRELTADRRPEAQIGPQNQNQPQQGPAPARHSQIVRNGIAHDVETVSFMYRGTGQRNRDFERLLEILQRYGVPGHEEHQRRPEVQQELQDPAPQAPQLVNQNQNQDLEREPLRQEPEQNPARQDLEPQEEPQAPQLVPENPDQEPPIGPLHRNLVLVIPQEPLEQNLDPELQQEVQVPVARRLRRPRGAQRHNPIGVRGGAMRLRSAQRNRRN
uniref:RING-type domain-containing protein n=1 Tax=Caenorhabditis tropicalis TaxID=1561998 RepID=A0A1I7UV55_9PELO